ncbi:MAG: TfoX/Sxy family protein [Candidatus Cloacimonetes bacterium]|nr:TfoX/Sxy family protein [Candidatus Cloacimonadota bacterium]MCF7814539.1 TfoX/Sxy family protein [Candidatus Cloacimonadota bacterium]MCF7867669.1 TfoX/Sxy family protein [Candidatus Cloacimonadota bacterium]MCF7883533.1 TfoX/Sxy family protein [Candidatus Cloacimonadota bacterium]
MKLHEMPNIGKQLAAKLEKVGINDSEEFITIGSKEAFVRIKTELDDGCINMLYTLEGAVQGIRWHSLSKDQKNELKIFYDSLEAK